MKSLPPLLKDMSMPLKKQVNKTDRLSVNGSFIKYIHCYIGGYILIFWKMVFFLPSETMFLILTNIGE